MRAIASQLVVLIAIYLALPSRAVGPSHVDLTWMSISNIYYELGELRILTDGYITRLPQSAFFGGGGDWPELISDSGHERRHVFRR